MSRPSIAAAVQQSAAQPKTSEVVAAEKPRRRARSRRKSKTSRHEDDLHPSQRSRVGRVNISAYFPPEVKASLRLVQAKRGGNVTELLGEALNMLFAKYGVPESAPQRSEE